VIIFRNERGAQAESIIHDQFQVWAQETKQESITDAYINALTQRLLRVVRTSTG